MTVNLLHLQPMIETSPLWCFSTMRWWQRNQLSVRFLGKLDMCDILNTYVWYVSCCKMISYLRVGKFNCYWSKWLVCYTSLNCVTINVCIHVHCMLLCIHRCIVYAKIDMHIHTSCKIYLIMLQVKVFVY